MNSPTLSVVIPAFNEEETLPGHLDHLLPLLEELVPGSWEVLVVDDGSSDATAAVVRNYGRPGVRLLAQEFNQGKGAALRRGIADSTGQSVLMCDADMATAPEALKDFFTELENGADIVIGVRRSASATIVRKQSIPRRLFGTVYYYLATVLLGVSVTDVNCGFKLFRGDLARELFAKTEAPGWAIDIEVLALAARRHCRIGEVPVVWRDGDKSSVRLVKDILQTLVQLVQLYFRLR